MTDTPQQPAVTRMEVELSRIRESPLNPRKTPGDLSELIASIRAKGVQTPIRLRPIAMSADFEIVYGWRRYLASLKAGRTTIPADVGPLTDQEAAEAAFIENFHRAAVHPLEEAEGIRHYHETHGVGLDEIAAKIGQKKGWVVQRLRLCELSKATKKAYLAAEITDGEALLLAGLWTPQLQEDALERLRTLGAGRSFEQVRGLLRDKYTLRLADAQFNREDENLLDGVGSCLTCPKRSGNQLEMYADVKSADVCTDRPCFEAKSEAAWQARIAAVKARGGAVLSPAEARRVLVGGQLAPGANFLDLDDECPGDPKERKLRQVIGRGSPAPTLARDDRGRVHELLPAAVAHEAMKKAGVKTPRAPKERAAAGGSSAPEPHPSADPAKAFEAEERKLKVTRRIAAAAGGAVRTDRLDVDRWRFLAVLVLRDCDANANIEFEEFAEFARASGLEAGWPSRVAVIEDLVKAVGAWPEAALQSLVVELHLRMVGADFARSTVPGYPDLLKQAVKVFELDLKQIEREVRDEQKAAAKAEAAAVPPPGARRAAKVRTPASASAPVED